MKLILSSLGFADDKVFKKILEKLNKPAEQIKLLYIPTANYGNILFNRLLRDLKRLGFLKRNITFFHHTKAQNYCCLDIDAIYVSGGNTFLLLKLIKECGFDKEIIKYINSGVTYIGASAGTHLVTKNTEHLLHFDKNLVGLSDFNGLGLFDGIVFCHYDKDREKYYNEAVKQNRYKIYAIPNDEIIVIEK